jgi:hypothetical protein
VLVVLTAVLAGCGDSTPRRTITGAEAIARLDDYLKSAVAATPASFRLRRITAEATDGGGCSKSRFADVFTGQVEANVVYETKVLSPAVGRHMLSSLVQLWGKQFGDVSSGHAPDFITVKAGPGGWGLFSEYIAPPGIQRLRIGGVSPCVWVNGTPGPKDDP